MAVPRWIMATAVAGTLTLTAAACGDDGDAPQEETSAAVEAAPETTTTTEAEMESESDAGAGAQTPSTVVEIAAGNEDFSTLVEAVEAAGLAETLSGEGPFTVFAPVNDAFAALPDGTLDTLLMPENRDQLTSVLTYHVVPAEAMASDLSDGMTVTTVQGEDLEVGVNGSDVTLTDASGNTVSVVQADVEADNGVVHVIDGVLLPAG